MKKTSEYYIVRDILLKSFSISKDCVKGFQLRELRQAVLAKANKRPRVTPYPIFFDCEKDIPFAYIPEMGELGLAAVARRAYKTYLFNVDLLTSVQFSLISTLCKSDISVPRDRNGNKWETIVHNT